MGMEMLAFNVTGLNVIIEEGFKLNWQGREIESGPMIISLDEPGGSGVIDYKAGRVNVEFRVKVTFPELFDFLRDMGTDPDITAPVEVTIRSEGVVFDDHSFRLAGKGEITEHRFFDPVETKIDIMAPTKCRPDAVSRSGSEIQAALAGGEAVSWNFNPTERRVVLVLPEVLGGRTHVLCLAGSYTFMGVSSGLDMAPQPCENSEA